MQELRKEGQSVALRSLYEKLEAGTNIYVVDTLGIPFTSFSLIFIAYIEAKLLEFMMQMPCTYKDNLESLTSY